MNAFDPAHWAVLSPLIDELLSLPPPERPQRLDRIAANDASLADELRTLLDAHDDASREAFLETPIAAALFSASAGAGAGDAVGAWTLVDAIGEGGMGSVWRARRGDGRFEGEAAVKLLRSGLFDVAAKERFRREGAFLARLRHPGIAQLLDAGVTPRGQPYLVLEMVRGEPIDRWCEARALGVRARIKLFLQVLDAVAAAHGQLVIHRDLKPSNILVDNDGRVKLLDFGIARLVPGQDDAAQTALTREGAFVLTPEYAAPEQFKHDALSMATDVYALGVVLYKLLAGAHPSGLPPGSTPLAYMKAAIESRHIAASTAAPKRRRELRGDIDTVLAKACATEPKERYVTASALRDDLQRLLEYRPITARPATVWYRTRRFVRRHPFETAVVGAVVAAVPAGAHVQAAVLLSFGLGTAVALWQLRRARQQAALARAEQRRAEAVKQFIASTFSEAVPREGAGGVVTAADLLHSAHARARAELNGQPKVAAELLAIVGDSFQELGDLPAAHAVLPGAAERCAEVFGLAHPITMHARASLAQTRAVRGELEAVEQVLPGLLGDLRAAMPASAADLISALRSLSWVQTKRGAADDAIRTAQEALRLAHTHFGPAHRHSLRAAALLGNTLSTFGRESAAIAALEPAVAAAREVFGARRPYSDLSQLESFLAASLLSSGRLDEAEALLRQVWVDQWALDGRDTIANRYTRNMLALALQSRGNLAEAIKWMREALAADARLTAAPTIDTGMMTHQLGVMLAEAGQIEEGLQAIERGAQIAEGAGGAGQRHPVLGRLARRAHVLLLAGRPGEALELALGILDQAHECAGFVAAIAARVRVGALRKLARLPEADAQVAAMMALAEAHMNPANRARTMTEAAALRLAQGRRAEAAQFARDAIELLAPTQLPESPSLRAAQEIVQECATRAGAAD